MKFGEPSSCSVDTANEFMVERVKKTPPLPPGGIGLMKVEKYHISYFLGKHHLEVKF